MIKPELLEILRCPVCVRVENLDGNLSVYQETWLICGDCQRKYPIIEDIPVMLIDEGEKWMGTPVEELPVPPPA